MKDIGEREKQTELEIKIDREIDRKNESVEAINTWGGEMIKIAIQREGKCI